MKKQKVLLFVDRLRVGGIQILLANLLETFDKTELEYELLTLDDGEDYDLEKKIAKTGIKIHKLKGIWVRKPQDYMTYCKAVKNFFKEHNDYIAVHINTGPKNYFVLKYAKKYGIKVRIAHSHNTGYQTNSKAQKILGDFFKNGLKKYATDYLACSDLAGQWMFGNEKFTMLPNGVDLEAYQFSQSARDKIQAELCIENKLVIGNVGRFTTQKNHKFLIDIFAEIYKKNENSVLLLAGIGETLDNAKAKAKTLNLENEVKFLGFREDVKDVVQAMDIFLMPSLYEGFPVTAVEAQCSGLPCVFSDTITKEAKILENVKYLPLEMPTNQWADEVLSVKLTDRANTKQELKQKGFDIVDMAKKLESYYLKKL
ncbi:MAG: glycosyltransferase family 1 protein [Clostridia bacterium]